MDKESVFLKEQSEGIGAEQLWKALEVVCELNRERDPDRLLAFILDAAIELVRAERGFIILGNEAASEGEEPFTVRLARNFDREKVSVPEQKISGSIVREVLRSGKTQVLDSAAEHPLFAMKRSVREQKLRSVICAPLRLDDDVAGAIYLDNRFAEQIFGAAATRLIDVFSAQASIALTNARHIRLLAEKTEQLGALNAELARHNNEHKKLIDEQRTTIDVLDQELVVVRDRVDLQGRFHRIRGQSEALRKTLALIDRVADGEETVLITGETGTGKELVARALHQESVRRKQRFLAINCAALSPMLLESELFGHLKGSWTGAYQSRDGIFVMADGGTLFLDEVSEIPLDLQAKLLRVLQEREVRAIGSDEPRPIDVRILAASNRDIEAMVRAKEFRSDLFYRLSVIPIHMPPLRKRDGDVAILAQTFLEDVALRKGWAVPKRLTRGALQVLEAHHWPGNVRELRNEIERACLTAGDTLTARDFSHINRGKDSDRNLPDTPARLQDMEKASIKSALEATDGHVRRAAKLLGIHHSTLYRKMRDLRIKKSDRR